MSIILPREADSRRRLDRRAFLGSLARVLAAAGLPALSGGCAGAGDADGKRSRGDAPADLLSSDEDPLDRLGVQLHTVRRELSADFSGTLERIRSIGYEEVEFVDYHGVGVDGVREALSGAGLASPSAHVAWQATGGNWPQVLYDAYRIGHRYLVVASLPPEQRQTLDDYRLWADRFNRAGESARDAGIRFAYHNHAFEFEPLDGQVPYEVLLAETQPDLVALEMDIYWITKAGHDPMTYFTAHPQRFPLLHLKDSTGSPDYVMSDVGQGTIDFPKLLAQRVSGYRHLFVEHDQPTDAFASLRRSFDYLSRINV